jgi:predicted MFS family arabinose efflux permease
MAGCRGAFLVLALLGLAALALAWRALPPDAGPEASRPGTLRDTLTAHGPLVRHRPTLGLVGAALLANIGIWTLLTYLGAFLADHYQFSTPAIGWAYLVHGLGFCAGTVAAGGRLGRAPLRPLLIGTLAGQGVLMALAFVLPVGPLAAVGLVALAMVLSGLGVVASATLLMGETPAGRATTMALNQTAMALGATGGGVLGGLALTVGGAHALGLLILVVSLAAALLAWQSRSR